MTRYLAYSNVESTPEIKAYDVATNAVLANITKDADTGYLKVTIPTAELNGVTDLEVLRFQQNAVDGDSQKFIGEVGTDEIAIRSSVVDGANTVFLLNHLVEDDNIVNTGNAGEAAIKILGKPSDFVEAYFDDTKGLVEGVSDVFYSKQLVLREIQKAAQRTTATDADNSGAAFGTFAAVDPGTSALAEFGLGANGGTELINWIDDRDPAIKIGYDETNQRLTFDGVSSQLGKGVGVGFDLFTVYSKKLDSGENGLGIEAFGNNKEIDLKTEEIFTEMHWCQLVQKFALKIKDTVWKLSMIPFKLNLSSAVEPLVKRSEQIPRLALLKLKTNPV